MGREAFGGGDIADARAALPQQTLDLHGLAGQQVDAGTAGSHAGQFGLEGFRILGQHREGAPVHGDDLFAAQQLAGQGRLAGVHGEDAAHGQQGHVDGVEAAPQFHAREDAGIARMVDVLAVRRADDVARRGARLAGVIRLGHGEFEARVGHGTAHVEADVVEQLGRGHTGGLQLLGRAHDGAQHGAGVLADGHGIAHMVGMVMGDQHHVHRADGLGRGTGSGRQEGVHDDMLVVTTDIEGRMAVPEDLAHDRSPCWGRPKTGKESIAQD